MKIPTQDDHLQALTHKERCAMFGSFSFTADPKPDNPERIVIDPTWVKNRIVTVEVPQLKRKVQMHKLAADDLLTLFAAWDDAGLLGDILTFNGGWAPRYKRGRAGGGDKDLSNHSWGTAFDANAKQNPLGKPPAPLGKPGSVLRLVPIAESLGWAWGGWWKRPDGMHWERAAL